MPVTSKNSNTAWAFKTGHEQPADFVGLSSEGVVRRPSVLGTGAVVPSQGGTDTGGG